MKAEIESSSGNIQSVALDIIRPYWRNPRLANDAAPFVAESIKRYGFHVPLVLDRQNVIICGHARFRAARLIQLTHVPVIYTDMTVDRARQFRIADNKTSELARWDNEKLKAELEVLSKVDEVRQLFGSPEWDKLLNIESLNAVTEHAQDDVVSSYEVCCPHCMKENVFTLAQIAESNKTA